MNNLLDFYFLNTTGLEVLKNLSFITAILGMITIGLYLFSRLFVINGNDDNAIIDTILIFIVFFGIIFLLAFGILFLCFIIAVPCYVSALLKSVIVQNYFSMNNLTPFKELFINISCAFIASGIYVKLLIRAFKNI